MELNEVILDNGTCGQYLTRDPVLTNCPTPSFVLNGDGGRASYAVQIDGAPIGTFKSEAYGNVCIQTTTPLADGDHVLTAKELAPNPANVVPPFYFTIDTVPPPVPSKPTMASYSDSGVAGDNVTQYRNVGLFGTAEPGLEVEIYNHGVEGFGFGFVNSFGKWMLKTVTLPAGTNRLSAVGIDRAGNVSAQSAELTVVVDNKKPTVSIVYPVAGATVSGAVSVIAKALDNYGIPKVTFAVDGVAKATLTAAPYVWAWNTAALAPGPHTLTVTALDTAGNVNSASIPVTVAS